MEITKRTYGVILTVLFIVGIIGVSIDFTRDFFTSLSPIHLFVSFLIILINEKDIKNAVLPISLLGSVGFIAEYLGVNHNILFGDYYYLDNLGPAVLGVPLMIPILWFSTNYSAYSFIKKHSNHPATIIIASSLISTLLDFLMEPLCEILGFWKWTNGSADWLNYLTWFGVSLINTSFLVSLRATGNSIASYFLFLQFGFFLILNLVLWDYTV